MFFFFQPSNTLDWENRESWLDWFKRKAEEFYRNPWQTLGLPTQQDVQTAQQNLQGLAGQLAEGSRRLPVLGGLLDTLASPPNTVEGWIARLPVTAPLRFGLQQLAPSFPWTTARKEPEPAQTTFAQDVLQGKTPFQYYRPQLPEQTLGPSLLPPPQTPAGTQPAAPQSGAGLLSPQDLSKLQDNLLQKFNLQKTDLESYLKTVMNLAPDQEKGWYNSPLLPLAATLMTFGAQMYKPPAYRDFSEIGKNLLTWAALGQKEKERGLDRWFKALATYPYYAHYANADLERLSKLMEKYTPVITPEGNVLGYAPSSSGKVTVLPQPKEKEQALVIDTATGGSVPLPPGVKPYFKDSREKMTTVLPFNAPPGLYPGNVKIQPQPNALNLMMMQNAPQPQNLVEVPSDQPGRRKFKDVVTGRYYYK